MSSFDYLVCCNCDRTFNDCGDYVSCDCGNSWCNDKCAEKDDLKTYKEDGCEHSSCKYCRGEDFYDDELLKHALELMDITREELIENFKNTQIILKENDYE